MNNRNRITIDTDLYHEALDYAAADNRTFSQLVGTALQQHMRRYPKKEKVDNDRLTMLEKRVEELLAIKRKP